MPVDSEMFPAVRDLASRIWRPFSHNRTVRRVVHPLVDPALRMIMPNPVPVEGYALHYHAGARWHAWAYSAGRLEQETVGFMRRELKPGMVVVDIGAYLGFYSLLAACFTGPQGRVYAFEPEPDSLAALTRTVDTNGLGQVVTIVPKALSSRHGRALLQRHRADSSRPTLADMGKETKDAVWVEVITLDTFMESAGWPTVDLVKMDAEGLELEILRGMKKTLRNSPDVKLVIEFCATSFDQSGTTAADFVSGLLDCGFGHAQLMLQAGGHYDLRSTGLADKLLERAGRAPVNLLCTR